jgi:hypothetical protein
MDIPRPSNLPLLIGGDKGQSLALQTAMTSDNLKEILHALGQYWKVHVWFSEPVLVRVHPSTHYHETPYTENGVQLSHVTRNFTPRTRLVTDHVFARFWVNGLINSSSSGLCYQTTRSCRARYGWRLPLEKIIRYEPVITKPDTFEDYADFRNRFNSFFISSAYIQQLWDENSPHGRKYVRSDFHKMGPRGRGVLKEFLQSFRGIGRGGGAGYLGQSAGASYTVLSRYYRSCSPSGRDITITHCSNNEFVSYASEGCGNGRYGIVANMSEFLWIEDD